MDKVEKSLKRIEGQVRGIAKMYSERKTCLDMVQQVAAVRAALGSVGQEMLKDEACKCMIDSKQEQKFAKILKQLFKN